MKQLLSNGDVVIPDGEQLVRCGQQEQQARATLVA
jgi:hypothetical protein